MQEIQAAAQANGQTIDDDFLEHMMNLTVKMKPYYTSMHLDLLHREPMEIEAIIGEPLRRGKQYGLELPEMHGKIPGPEPAKPFASKGIREFSVD